MLTGGLAPSSICCLHVIAEHVHDIELLLLYLPTGRHEYGYLLRTFKLEDTDGGELTTSVRFVPHF
jgi:hypothetical protein